jgi:glutaredoxin
MTTTLATRTCQKCQKTKSLVHAFARVGVGRLKTCRACYVHPNQKRPFVSADEAATAPAPAAVSAPSAEAAESPLAFALRTLEHQSQLLAQQAKQIALLESRLETKGKDLAVYQDEIAKLRAQLAMIQSTKRYDLTERDRSLLTKFGYPLPA